MPRYDYECGSCGHREEHYFSMADKPTTLDCRCGGYATSLITGGSESFVRNRPYEFNKAKCVRSNGHMFGRTDEQQHALYRKQFEDIDKRQKSLALSKNKHEMQWIGGMPGEMADSIGEHEGDKEAVIKDPIPFLKKTGLYSGE